MRHFLSEHLQSSLMFQEKQQKILFFLLHSNFGFIIIVIITNHSCKIMTKKRDKNVLMKVNIYESHIHVHLNCGENQVKMLIIAKIN